MYWLWLSPPSEMITIALREFFAFFISRRAMLMASSMAVKPPGLAFLSAS